VVGPGTQLCTLFEVWVLGVGMSTLDGFWESGCRRLTCKQIVCRGSGTLSSSGGPGSGSLSSSGGPGAWQHCGDSMLHTNCLQVAIKTHSFHLSLRSSTQKPLLKCTTAGRPALSTTSLTRHSQHDRPVRRQTIRQTILRWHGRQSCTKCVRGERLWLRHQSLTRGVRPLLLCSSLLASLGFPLSPTLLDSRNFFEPP
jgi:hypothetical protein